MGIHSASSLSALLQGNTKELATVWLIIMISVSFACFIVSELTRNYSQVDKLWSIIPIGYSIVTLIYAPGARVWIMSALVALWGIRLSYNFYRKGGYSLVPWKGDEDYRWKVLRETPSLKGRIRFGLFNLFFISLYQNLLIMLFSSPLLLAASSESKELNITDLAAAVFMLLFILTETVADNQLFMFHQLKEKAKVNEGLYTVSLKRGFMSEGLWKYVRHPNFISEQLIWVSFYFFSVAATGSVFTWSLPGPILLILLFAGSSSFTEKISSGKYPDYSAYRKEVPRFIPRIF
jgi:steroid 5-alpha reductase family enzyme